MRAARCARIAGEIAMELAKQFVDVGIFTNQIEQMRAFYGERIRLPYEALLPVGGGVRQYRYGLLGSVLKINHTRDPLAPRIAGGYRLQRHRAGAGGTTRRQSDRNPYRRHRRGRLREILRLLDGFGADQRGPLQARQHDYQLPARSRG